jgi:hypothetical protein
MGGGAAVAVIAARQRRIQEIVDAFRLADATAADRARSLDTLGLPHNGELQSLIVEGVLMPGAREGTYYLSEIGYIYKREDRRALKAVAIVMIVMLIIGALLIPIMSSRG